MLPKKKNSTLLLGVVILFLAWGTYACSSAVRMPASIEEKAPLKLLRDDIYRVVYSHSKELNTCYKMRINKKVEDCITSLMKTIKFPKFDGDTFKDEVYINFDSRSLI